MASCNYKTEAEQEEQIFQEIAEDKINIEYGGIIIDDYNAINKTITSGTAVSNLFINAGVDPKTAYQLNFTPDSIFSAKRVRAGKSYTIYQTKERQREYRLPDRQWRGLFQHSRLYQSRQLSGSHDRM